MVAILQQLHLFPKPFLTVIFKRLPYTLLFLFLLAAQLLSAQVYFFSNEEKININGSLLRFYIDSSTNRTQQQFELIRDQLRPLGENKINLSYQNEMLWLQIPLTAVPDITDLKNIMIRNPHINYLQAWVLRNDSIIQSFAATGDHLPFNSRTLYHADFVYPVPLTNRDKLSFLFLIDKRNEQLNIPVHFVTENGFTSYNLRKNLLAGLMTGMGLFLFLFSFFLYYTMRERLYVYYSLYILMVFFYIFSDYGYSFMYLFPNHPFPADFTRPMAISLASPLYMMFALNLLSVKQKLPAYYKWAVRYLILYMSSLVISLFLMPDTGVIRMVLVWLMQIYQNLTAVFMLIIAIAAVRKKIPYAGYIVGTSIVLLLAFFIFMQFVSGFILDTFLTRNMMNIGFTLEISILAFVLTLRFRQYKEQSEQLLRTTNLQQEQIFKSISDYQEKEMQRYSSMLHDSVGARLSAIRFNLESIKKNTSTSNGLEQSITDLGELATDVRQFSHTLSPVLLQKKGLVAAVEEIVTGINQSGQLYIQFESIGTLQKVSFRYELLLYNIMQELIQNIIKHAGATEVIIQVILEKELIYLFVEDNGHGFNPLFIKEGLGFSQIKQLVTFVQGTLAIDSLVEKGCRITIEFPVLPDEANHPTPSR
ncbi:sensor histidine kinase [Lacibacter sp. H407]|uniref:sensor histidine kinase n=1 Tax=Lacibacter sp. H407 TaxID=3133423 RepID=UPI0030C30836